MRAMKKVLTKITSPREVREISREEEIPTFEVEETARVKEIGRIEPINIKSMDLQSIETVQEVAEELQDGNIVILDISPLMDRSPEDLKRAINQLKGVCQGIGGGIGRITEYKVIAAPKFVHIQFRKEA